VGGRILVVAPSESEDRRHSSTDSSVRTDDAPGTDGDGTRSPTDGDGTRSPTDGDGERAGDTPGAEDHDEPSTDPEFVADGIADRLSAEVVLKDERTAEEYLADLGPTVDCVVVLGSDIGPLGRLENGVSIPAVVCERPVVGTEAPDSATIPVSAVADRVRAVVREVRGRSDLQDRHTRLTALSRYARDITSYETVDAALDRTVEAATDALAFDYCVILIVDGDRLVPRASALPAPDLTPTGVTEGIAGRALETGDAEVVADMQSDPDAVVEHDDLHAILTVPIGSRGVLQVMSRSCGAFDDPDKEFAEILSGYTREALARLEREVALRAERDRLHAFYTEIPVPVLCVERRAGEMTVTEANGAYEEAFAGGPTGRSLAAVVPTRAERDRYETALTDDALSRGTVVRTIDDREADLALTVIPVSPPGDPEYAFGVYRTDRVDADETE
jgi:PAS domain-containing protein